MTNKNESAQPQFCPHCKGTREQCEDNEYCQYRWSAQPQLPPLDDCPRCKGSGQVESISFVNSSKRVTRGCNLCHGTGKLRRDLETLEHQLLSAQAENESLKAERDKALEVIREYRLSSISHRLCSIDFGCCSTCIKADALLARKTKET